MEFIVLLAVAAIVILQFFTKEGVFFYWLVSFMKKNLYKGVGSSYFYGYYGFHLSLPGHTWPPPIQKSF